MLLCRRASPVLVCCPRYSEANVALLERFGGEIQKFSEHGTAVFAIFPNEKTARRHASLPFPVLADRQRRLLDLFGSDFTTVVLRNNNHVKGIVTGDAEPRVELSQDWPGKCKGGDADYPNGTSASPVLLVPEVFSAADCQRLIDIFHTRGKTFLEKTEAIDYLGTDYKMRIPEHLRRDRNRGTPVRIS